jgi:hypothetical protein
LSAGAKISSAVTAAIALGFIAFSFGVGLWAWEKLDQAGADSVTRLVIAGFLILVFGVLASRLFARVE